MQGTIASIKAGSERKRRKVTAGPAVSNYAVGEIKAYIAIRDELLAEAEQFQTPSKLEGLAIANKFVENCLAPSRPPYQGQYLAEEDAVRERRRCRHVKLRLADLREHIDLRSNRS